MKIDFKKTVLLFASIHLLIAWVAERQEKTKNKAINTRSVAVKSGGYVVKAKKTAMPVMYAGFDYRRP